LPDGGTLDEATTIIPFALDLQRVLNHGRTLGQITRDAQARDLWHHVYPTLSEGRSGLLGAVTARAEAQVLRLSCLYALLDCSSVVKEPHLKAALALWQYVERSALFIFGDTLGDPYADRLWEEMKRRGREGISRWEISDFFSGNLDAKQIGQLLSQLAHRLERKQIKTAGRPEERWYARETYEVNEGSLAGSQLTERETYEVNEVSEQSVNLPKHTSLTSFTSSSMHVNAPGDAAEQDQLPPDALNFPPDHPPEVRP
jgi:hypothetical protein